MSARTMNQIMLSLPPPMLQYSANLISFYFQHVRPYQGPFIKRARLILLILFLLNFKSLPGIFHGKMLLRATAVQLYALRHRKRHLLKPTETSIVRERVWFDDLDINFHFSNSSYGKNCDYSRIKYIASLFGTSVLPMHPARKIAFALGGTQFFFKKEVSLFQTIEIRTRLLAWNQKWFIIEHRMYTPSTGNGQKLCAIGVSKFVLKHTKGSLKGKTIPFLEALEMVGHDVRELRALEIKSEGSNVVLYPKDELEFKSYEGWTTRGGAFGNALELSEQMLTQP